MASTPSIDWGEKVIYAGRTEKLWWKAHYIDSSGAAQALGFASQDVVRFKLTPTPGELPTLDVDSIGALSGGSIVIVSVRGTTDSVPASGYVLLAQGDTSALTARKYQACELALVDSADSNRIKTICRGTINLKASPLGDTGLT